MDQLNYIEINKNAWNEKVDVHVASDFYDLASFMKGETSLNSIELDRLGKLEGKRILHLQCHFGQDSISLSRMGAIVTGVDFSDKAIEKAKELAIECGTNTKFICCDIYDLPNHLDQKYDIVFTSYGTIGWLPDLDKWAKVVSQFLVEGGQFVFVDFHPVVWMYDDAFTEVTYRYFNAEPIIEHETGTYAEKNSSIETKSIGWNHGLGEIFTALLNHELAIDSFAEFDYSPYSCFQKTIEIAPKKFQLEPFGNKIPIVYAIVATKK